MKTNITLNEDKYNQELINTIKEIKQFCQEKYDKPINEFDEWQLGYRRAAYEILSFIVEEIINNNIKD